MDASPHLFQFGTGVLIDPFFAAPNLGECRAKKSQSLLDALLNLAPTSRDQHQNRLCFDDSEEANRDVLYDLTSTLCIDDEARGVVANYFDAFFIKYPSKVKML